MEPSLTIGDELFRCTESLFDPSLCGSECPGIHQLLFQSIQRIDDADLRRQVYSDIVLGGGNTLFKGFSERLHNELQTLVPGEPVKVSGIPNRKCSAWIGGSMLASRVGFEKTCISKAEYLEYGSQILRQKCLV